MNARIPLYCLISLVSPSVLAGCTLFGTSISIPDPTDQNEAESGPASISGTLTVQAPLLKVGSSSEALDTYATMGFDLDAHLYLAGGKDPAQFHYINDYQPWTTADPASGTYTIDLSYTELPYGSYEIRIGRWWKASEVLTENGVAVDIVEVTKQYSVLARGPIVLSESEPHAGGCDLALNLARDDFSVSGRMLFDGWGPVVKQEMVALETRELSATTEEAFPVDPEDVDFSWTIPLIEISDGRLYYEITGLHEDYYVFLPAAQGYSMRPFDNGYFQLNQQYPQATVHLAAFNPLPSIMHELDQNTLEGRVYFTGEQCWNNDLVIVASATSGETGPGYQARQWLNQAEIPDGFDPATIPWDIELNRHIELQGAVLLKLGTLLPGDYELSAWMYGDEPGQRIELPIDSGPFTVPSSERPAGYQHDPTKLYPWLTNISVEFDLEVTRYYVSPFE